MLSPKEVKAKLAGDMTPILDPHVELQRKPLTITGMLVNPEGIGIDSMTDFDEFAFTKRLAEKRK